MCSSVIDNAVYAGRGGPVSDPRSLPCATSLNVLHEPETHTSPSKSCVSRRIQPVLYAFKVPVGALEVVVRVRTDFVTTKT